jgi:hypothetical protein
MHATDPSTFSSRTPHRDLGDVVRPGDYVVRGMREPAPAAVRVANHELATVREAMRELNRLVAALEHGELEKVVLTNRNQMRAVIVSLERFAQLERGAAGEEPAPTREAA